MPLGYDYSKLTDSELLKKEKEIKNDHFGMIQLANELGTNTGLYEDQQALQAITREKSERKRDKESQLLEYEKNLNDIIKEIKESIEQDITKNPNAIFSQKEITMTADEYGTTIAKALGRSITRRGGNS